MRVIKRVKGGAEYFYLQHSFREGNRVITREAYLGKSIPKNIDEIRAGLELESRRRLHEKLEAIKEGFRKEWGAYPESIREKAKQQIAIAFTYNTNAIEGSTITLEETREIIEDKVAPNKPLADVMETEAHANVFLAMLRKKEKISNELLLSWHKKIFGETKPDIAGNYRDYSVRVGGYRAPDWQDVSKLMDGFVAFTNTSRLHPVELAAVAHYRFEKIHPFCDGNGRVGRLLMNHILWHASHPMLIIEYKYGRSYYRALERDETGFTNYFARRYISVHKRRLRQ